MTNEVKRKVLALWLPECVQCGGDRISESKPAGAGHADDLPEYEQCPRCDGIGYTLDDAGDDWPFWEFDHYIVEPSAEDRKQEQPRLPDFTDPRDAVTLAHRMGVTVRFERDCVIVEGQSIREPFLTLGEALLSALGGDE